MATKCTLSLAAFNQNAPAQLAVEITNPDTGEVLSHATLERVEYSTGSYGWRVAGANPTFPMVVEDELGVKHALTVGANMNFTVNKSKEAPRTTPGVDAQAPAANTGTEGA